MVDELSLLGSIASIMGISFENVAKKFKDKNERTNVKNRLTNLFRAFEEENDPLTGTWKVASWDYHLKRFENFNIGGELVVHYRLPKSNRWVGLLVLDHQYDRSRLFDNFGIKKQFHRLTGKSFVAIYQVSLFMDNDIISGQTALIYRNPRINKAFYGELRDIALANNSLIGAFHNTNVSSKKMDIEKNKPASFVFNQHFNWKHYQPDNL